jgi:hypothetical protein
VSLFEKPSGKTSRELRVLGIVLLVLGGVGLYVGRNYVAIQFLGYLALGICAVGLPARDSYNWRRASTAFGAPRRPGLWLWIISIVSVLPALASYLYMYSYDARGGQADWPLYLMVTMVGLCLMCWFVLMQRLERYWARSSDFDVDA